MLKYNLSELKKISKKIASKLSKTDCHYLYGELGSGKTTFARNLINHLQDEKGVNKTEVLSPTFNLLYEYEIKSIKVMHYDLYRLEKTEEIDQLGVFENHKNKIILIEWPEKLKKNIENRLEITFDYCKDELSRELSLQGYGKWENFKINAV